MSTLATGTGGGGGELFGAGGGSVSVVSWSLIRLDINSTSDPVKLSTSELLKRESERQSGGKIWI